MRSNYYDTVITVYIATVLRGLLLMSHRAVGLYITVLFIVKLFNLILFLFPLFATGCTGSRGAWRRAVMVNKDFHKVHVYDLID